MRTTTGKDHQEDGRRRIFWAIAGLFVIAVVVLPAGCADAPSPLRPESETAREIRNLAVVLLIICAAIFLVVEGLLLTSILRFRRRPEEEARQVHGNRRLETTWTLIPAILVIIIFALTVRTMATVDLPGGDLPLKVTGHQWWWQVEYTQQGFTTANEIHVPAGWGISAELESADVIHSFWVPQLGGKTDMVPGRTNHTSFLAPEVGIFQGKCAEFCGTQHANMRFLLVVEPPEEFSRWVEHQQEPAREPGSPKEKQGLEVFQSAGCAGCHTIRGTDAQGTAGPDLTHFAGRSSLAAGTMENTPENLKSWLADPAEVKPGNKMPNTPLDEQQIEQLSSYLLSLE